MKAIRYSLFMILLGTMSMLSLSAQVVEIIDVSTTPTTCSNSLDGSITFTISGGVAPYRWFIYSDGGIPDDFGGPTAVTTITSTGRKKYGSYLLVVRDFNDDAGTVFVPVDGPNPISIGPYSSVDISCNNVNDGSITVTATGEGGNYFFDLAGPVPQTNTSGTFTGLLQGDYTVTVRDQGLCTTTDVTPVITINNPSLISANLDNITDVSCFGDFTGSIAITPSGGTPSGVGTGYTYLWTGPSGPFTTEDISNLEAGDYFVTITDGNGCSSNLGPYTVNQPSQINATLTGSSDVLCFNGNDGTASISVSGGAGGYIYSWIGQVNGLVSNDPNPTNLLADTYNLIVEDLAGCSQTFTDIVTIDEPAQLSITVNAVNDVNCNGGSDGSVDILPSGGTPNYTFLWTGTNFGFTSTDEDPTGMPADDYSVTITDNNLCSRTYTDILTIAEPPGMIMTLDGTTDVSCFGGNDGAANVTVTGGSLPYSFSWVGAVVGPASSVEDPDDLLADTYSLFVLDSKGCFISSFNFVVIDQPPGITVAVDQITDVDCFGDATGTIEITPAGGTPTYNYAWTGDNGVTSTDEDPTGLPEGSYSLIVRDGNNCIGDYDDLAYVAENPEIEATFAVSDLNCGDPSPSNDGSIDVTISGGVGPYTFSWTGPFGFTSFNEDISALVPGDYILEVTDFLGCVQLFPAQSVGIPPALTASASQVDIDCFGAGDGSIDLSVLGGTPPYSFAWTGPSGFTASTEDISNLEAGAYSVTITDVNGCPRTYTDIATISEVAQILPTTVTTDITCNGGSDGAIDVTITGGVGPYSFAWTGPNGFTATTEDITGLEAGNYSLTVTDANSCVLVFTDLETLTEPSAITVTYTQVDVVTCYDTPEGSISATGAGGTPPILYSLDGSVPGGSGDFSGLTVGNHTLTLTDQNGCSMDSVVEILGPPPLVITNLAITDVTGCAEDSNGSLVVTASGGTPIPGYLYSLDSITFQPSPIFTGLPIGLDTVYVRDANGCTTGDTFTMGGPDPVTAVVVKTDASFGSLGSISISGATGGTPPYEYSIQGPSGPFSSNTSYTDLPPATYHVMVRDQNGCEYNDMVDILDIVPLTMVINVNHVTCFGADDGSIEFLPQDAVGDVLYSIDNGGSFVSTPLFENLAGNTTYDLVAIDDDGKVFTSTVNITEPTAMTFSATVIDAQCNKFSPTGEVNITVTGGTGPYNYLWSDGSTDEDRTAMLAGSYTVEITDANSCMHSEMVIIGSDFTVVAYAGEDTSVCYGESVQLSGIGDYTPVWTPAQYLDQSDVLNPTTVAITEPITFTLRFTHTVSGCSNSDTVTVSPYPEVDISLTPDTFVLEGGSAQLEVFGGPYPSYQWTPASSLDNSTIANPVATPFEATWYYVSVLNEYGCEQVDSVFVDFLEDITVFNVFTPNGDGINEYFEIENAHRFPEMLVEVYSRWGDLLFSTVGYDSGSWWDGTTRGKEAPVGTYYYVIIPFQGAKPLTGHVTIIR